MPPDDGPRWLHGILGALIGLAVGLACGLSFFDEPLVALGGGLVVGFVGAFAGRSRFWRAVLPWI